MAKLMKVSNKDELIIRVICDSLKRLIANARQSIDQKKINHFDMMQINSFHRERTFSKSLNIQLVEKTYVSYIMIWQRLLSYIIRTNEKNALKRPLYQLTTTQKKRLDSVMKQASASLEIPAFDVAYQSAVTQLDKKCCTLCITLLDHQLYGSEYESVKGRAVVGPVNQWDQTYID